MGRQLTAIGRKFPDLVAKHVRASAVEYLTGVPALTFEGHEEKHRISQSTSLRWPIRTSCDSIRTPRSP